MDSDRSQVIPLTSALPLDSALGVTFSANRRRLIQYLRLRLGNVEEAEDAAHLAFLRLWTKKSALDHTNLHALLFVAARNVANDILRERKVRERYATAAHRDAECLESASASISPEREVIARHALDTVISLIDELPERCRTAFRRYRLEHASYSDIAVEMGISESMVRKYVLRAVAHCSRRFDELDGWE